MNEEHDEERIPTRTAWMRARWRAFVVLAVAIPLVVVSVRDSVYWAGRVFPGFFVLGNRVVPVVGLYDWTGRAAGLPPLSRIVAVEGRPVSDSRTVYEVAASRPLGTPIVYGVDDRGRHVDVSVPTMRFGPWDWWLTFGLFLANGLMTIAAGVAVALLQPGTPASTGFLAFGFLSGLIMLSAPPIYHPLDHGLMRLNIVAHAFWGTGFVHLGMVFPVMRSLAQRRPASLALPYLASALLAAWTWYGFYLEPPDMRPMWVCFIYVGTAMIGLAVAYWRSYRRETDPVTHLRLRIILPGLVLSCAIAAFGFLENALFGRFPINLAVLFPAFFYLAVGYAIVRHDLFDIDRFVRQAVVYTAVSVVLTVGYAGTIGALGLIPGPRLVGGETFVNVSFIVFVAVMFDPLRTRIQALIDRAFFRARVNYRRTVRDVSAALTTVLDLDEILDRVSAALHSGLAPSGLTMVLWGEAATREWRLEGAQLRQVPAPERSDDLRAHLVASGRRSWRGAGTAAVADGAAAAREQAAARGATLIVPLVVGERVIGAFLLGEKRSGLPYGTGDRELLETLAAQSAIAIDNAGLFREITELNRELEAKVEGRTAELQSSNSELRRAYRDLQDAQAQLLQSEKMASLGQLTAGLAHEINTPVTAVVGNVKPLWSEIARLRDRAGLHGDATLEASVSRLRAIAEVMARGAERTASIVQDLRVFSRVGETKPLPMDLHEAIEVSLRLLRPRWADHIEIHRDFGRLPAIEAQASQVNQVLMNLLANAFDAIATKGHVWIRTEADETHATVAVRDDGCGIATEDIGRIFDPFFTTKPVGKGMGLGLAISASIVRDHGGTLTATSVPGAGTTMTLRLPLRASPAAAGCANAS